MPILAGRVELTDSGPAESGRSLTDLAGQTPKLPFLPATAHGRGAARSLRVTSLHSAGCSAMICRNTSLAFS
jgi:hypothetical protein